MALSLVFIVALILPFAPQQANAQPREASRPELVLQTSHAARPPAQLAFSNDGRLIASTNGRRGDGVIKLWEIASGRPLRTLSGHKDSVNAIAFSPDSRTLASGGEDDTIRIWDVITGQEINRFFVPALGVSSLLFSPDNRYLVSLAQRSPYIARDREPTTALKPCPNVKDKPGFCDAKDLSVWDVRADRFLFNIDPPTPKDLSEIGTHQMWHVAFASDSKTLGVSVDGNPIQLWNIVDQRLSAVLSAATPPFVFDTSGRRVATSSANSNVIVWDVAKATVLSTLSQAGKPAAFTNRDAQIITVAGDENTETISIWNVVDGKSAATLKLDPIYDCANCSLHFSADGRWIARGGWGEPKLFLWDLAKPESQPRAWLNLSAPIVFSPTGQWLAAVTNPFFDQDRIAANDIWLLNLIDGTESCASASPLGKIQAVAISSSPARIATGGSAGIDLWDVAKGELIKNFPTVASDLAFSSDGRLLAAGYTPSNEAVSWLPGIASEGYVPPRIDWQQPRCVTPPTSDSDAAREDGGVWDTQTLHVHRNWPQMMAPIAISNDGKLIANGAEGRVVNLWNLSDKTGRQLKIGDGGLTSSDHTSIRAVAFSPKRHWLAIALEDDPAIQVWDIDSNLIVVTLSGPSSIVALAFSPVSGLLASASEDGSVKLWDVLAKKELMTLRMTATYRPKVSFSNDGRELAATIGEKVVRWNVLDGSELPPLEVEPNTVNDLAYASDSSTMLTASDDGMARLWDRPTNRQIATLISIRGTSDWLVVTPDGLFDGSPRAWNEIIWRFNNDTFEYKPVEAYFSDFYYPGLLSEIFKGKRLKAPADISRKDRRQPLLKIAAAETADGAREVTVRIEVANAPAGARDVRLFRNGSLVRAWSGDVLKRQTTTTLEATIPIVAGANRITAYAFNRDNIKSGDSTIVVNGADSLKRQGSLYILAVGVGKHANPNYDLDYTPDDATAFATQLRLEQEKLGQYQTVKVSTLLNENATKQNILAEFKKLAAAVQPEDAVVIYFSGHGKADGDHFYLIPHDLGYTGPRDQLSADGLRRVLAHSISDLELEESFRDLDAGQIFMIIDACNSGQALENKDEPRRGPMNTRGLAQLAYEKGMYIMAASQNVEEAFVSEKLKHSYLTFALVEEGLKMKLADENRDGQVTLREWFSYASTRVPKLREETLESKSLEEEDPTVKTVRSQKTQTPRAFYRREPEGVPFVVARVGTTR